MAGMYVGVLHNAGYTVVTHFVRRLDIPKAPLLLGQLVGSAIDKGSLQGADLHDVCKCIEDTEARRELLAYIFKTLQVCLLTIQKSIYRADHRHLLQLLTSCFELLQGAYAAVEVAMVNASSLRMVII